MPPYPPNWSTFENEGLENSTATQSWHQELFSNRPNQQKTYSPASRLVSPDYIDLCEPYGNTASDFSAPQSWQSADVSLNNRAGGNSDSQLSRLQEQLHGLEREDTTLEREIQQLLSELFSGSAYSGAPNGGNKHGHNFCGGEDKRHNGGSEDHKHHGHHPDQGWHHGSGTSSGGRGDGGDGRTGSAGSNPGNGSGEVGSPGNPGAGDSSTSGGASTETKLLLGVAYSRANGENYTQALQSFESQTGLAQSEHMMYLNMNTAKQPDLSAVKADAQDGVTPVLSLRTNDYTDVTSGKDDAYLTELANQLKQVNGTVLLRPNWEMDGNKNQQYGSPEQFVAAWQYMHNFLQKEGVTNVKWLWTPDAGAFDSKTPSWAKAASLYYPGNQYVDYVGADGYSGLNGGSAKSPTQIFDPALQFAEQNDKPFYIGETGVASTLGTAADVQYIQQMEAFIKANPDIQGLSWFSEGNNNVFSSPQELQAFEQMEKDLGVQAYSPQS